MRKFVSVLVFLFMAVPSLALGIQPMDVVKGPMNEVLELLKSPEYKEVSKRDFQREKIWEIIRRVFDFNEMAKRALARNWKSFSPEQQKEFSELFAEFLGNTYIDKIQGGFQDEKVVYLKQEMKSRNKAFVKTKIVRESMEIPVGYNLKILNGTWKVYDVNIEGVSLVKNYRSQFRKILMRKSPAHLINRLKKKIEKQKNAREEAARAGSYLDNERFAKRLYCMLKFNPNVATIGSRESQIVGPY